MILIDTIILTIICVITELHILYVAIGIAMTKRITQTKYICKGVRQKPFLYSILYYTMPSTTILVINKGGEIKETNVKTVDENELHKKAGFKNNQDFECHHTWNIDDTTLGKYDVSLYGKTTGRANMENKYDLPPPLDNTLFFGACLLVASQDGEYASLTEKEWNATYEHLFGGFDDIGDEDDDTVSEDELTDVPRTKEGYVKDDFIVDDDEDNTEDVEEDDDEDTIVSSSVDEEEIESLDPDCQCVDEPPSHKRATRTSKRQKNARAAETKPVSYLDCTDELSEEEYV